MNKTEYILRQIAIYILSVIVVLIAVLGIAWGIELVLYDNLFPKLVQIALGSVVLLLCLMLFVCVVGIIKGARDMTFTEPKED